VAVVIGEGLVVGPVVVGTGVVAAVVNMADVVVFAVLILPEVDGRLLTAVVGKTDKVVLEKENAVPLFIELELVIILSRDVRLVDGCDEAEGVVILVTTELVFVYEPTGEVRLLDKDGCTEDELVLGRIESINVVLETAN
jgi:hypothetical protein